MRLARTYRGSTVAVAALGALVAWLLPVSNAQAAAPTTYTIGVDFGSPTGHNFQFTDFFPRGLTGTTTNIHNGDVIDFKWDQGSLDGFHTATMVPQNQTPNQVWAANPVVGADGDDGAGKFAFLGTNPGTFGTSPPPGSGAPGACGDAATPCLYDGSSIVSSGGTPTAPGADYVVKISLPGTVTAATTVNFVCIVHPGMQGAVTVVPDGQAASVPSDVQTAAAAQGQADTTEALNAESSAPASTTTTNPDGTHTVTATAGTASAHTEVLEMLPQSLHVAPGDTVKWTTQTQRDIHTVTFPAGPGSNSVDPFNSPVCETASGPDTMAPDANGPPPFGCSSPAAAEIPFVPDAAGPSAILKTGYRMAATDGGIFDFGGNTKFFGSTGNITLNKPVVGTADTGDSQGYWNVASDGGIFAFGDAGFFGSTGNIRLNKPVVSMAPTPDGQGYALVASDGGIFAFGDFPFLGSTGNIKLNQPVVGMATEQNAPGYWLVASDGGIFAFGAAPFLGSMGGKHLNKPIVGMASTPDGGGYWLVASDGGIFSFGDAQFFGSTGNIALNQPIVGMAPSDSGNGYWLVASDGGIFAFGDATFQGSTGGIKLNKPVVGMAAAPVPSTAGVLSNPPAPFPSTHSFSFPQVGTFQYQCRIHDHMRGAISVG